MAKNPDRGVGLLIEGGQILLIDRVKDGDSYVVVPGGQVEPGETPEEACAREFLEEVNLHVAVGELLHTFRDEGRTQWFYRVERLAGEMRFGDGPERDKASATNQFHPRWYDLAAVRELDDLRPREALDLILDAAGRTR